MRSSAAFMAAVLPVMAAAQSIPAGSAIGTSFTATTGAQMSEFRIAVAGSQCIARMKFLSRDGRSGEAVWTFVARQETGYTRCVQGAWRELVPDGRSGRMNSNIIIVDGAPRWERR